MTANGARRVHHYETQQRRAILHALARAPGFLSAQALHAHMHAAGHTIALTTVYRAPHVYADTGRIDSTYDATGGRLFHLGPDTGRSHYLVCRGLPLDAAVARDWAAATAADNGFTDINPVIELTGMCPACSAS
ncbi:Fur family transcriptional regulator [Kutzneria buriramensis]|uniref:Fur family ferric uptake transcriptional regulator n=1 Tax=Kutzneria buriramensis TaxID=1045776 RepID=A0A3E0H1M2_9PSEU|nr:transcriptional repressor [Kutzneria buriramensis]REH35668.1 Fur family ferric uptake transcriptional regulator [Kutzneria buriramensis]